MNTISIQTTQNVEVEYDIASLGDRMVGQLLDWLIEGAYIFLWYLFLITVIGFGNGETTAIIFTMAGLLPVLFYPLLMEQFFNGQTVGKRVMNTRVISLDGAQPSFSQYLLRWIFIIIDFQIFSGLVALITVAVTERKQRIGDLVAGTTVIKTTPRASLQQTLYVPVAENYEAMYPEVVRLNDQDIQLVKEVIMNVERSGNTMLAYQAGEKIKRLLGISTHLEPVPFLHQVLQDYNHLTTQEE